MMQEVGRSRGSFWCSMANQNQFEMFDTQLGHACFDFNVMDRFQELHSM